jgi:hypothetical protein
MSLPGWDSLEIVGAIHSFLERWAIVFFGAVVLCDTILHFLEDRSDIYKVIGWKEYTINIAVGGHVWIARWPAYSDTLSGKRLLKKLSLLGFATAILLELLALPYSDRLDFLSNQERDNFNRQTAASLRLIVKLHAENISNGRALEEERTARLELQAKVAWRIVSPLQLSILKKRLASVHGEHVMVQWDRADTERDNFGKQLLAALNNSGLNAIESSGMYFSPREAMIPPIELKQVSEANSGLAKTIEDALVAAALAKRPIPTVPPDRGLILNGGMLMVAIGPRSHI